MYVGTLSFDLLLGDVRSLKEKRSVVRPIVAELQRKYAVSVAEIGRPGPPPQGRDRPRGGVRGHGAPHRRTGPVRAAGRRPARSGAAVGTTAPPRRRRLTTRRKDDREGEGPVADNARAKRLADLIREVVAEKLQRGIKDPRLGTHVTITDTRVTGDLREATVFYTVYGDDEERAAAAAGPGERQGRAALRGRPAAGVKFTPTLAFVADALPDNAATIEDLLDKARAVRRGGARGVRGRAVRRRRRPVPQAGRRGRTTTDERRRMTRQKHTHARRPCHRRQAVGLHLARRRRQDARHRPHPPRRPRRHPRPDGDGRPRPRRREGHQAPRPPRADREGVPRHHPARPEHASPTTPRARSPSSTDASRVTREAIDAGVAKLTGDIMQVPSKVSAIKIDGVRSYKRVREGEDFEHPGPPGDRLVLHGVRRPRGRRRGRHPRARPGRLRGLLLRHVHPRPRPRPGRRPGRRRPPHGAAPHPRRPVQAGRGAARWTSSSRS